MVSLQATWADGNLHTWGSREIPASGSDAPEHVPLPSNEIRELVGEFGDSLLAADATASILTLTLPHRAGKLIVESRTILPDGLELRPVTVPTLSFTPAAAMDLLTSLPHSQADRIHLADSFRFWSSVAGLVLELLGRQRFVPAIHERAPGQLAGYWRVVVDDERTSQALRSLVASMPPICRALADAPPTLQASSLVEGFLWKCVDALVRRCMHGDELTHAIPLASERAVSPQMLWLRSLVGENSNISLSPEDAQALAATVRTWLSRLEPEVPPRSCRTCFELSAPAAHDRGDDPPPGPLLDDLEQRSWRLALFVQSVREPTVVLGAKDLQEARNSDQPQILPRPFDNALEEMRADVKAAARHFPKLLPLSAADGPLECDLNLGEAYTFLREAAPLLEAEGHGVWLPRWWRQDRPRLRLRLDLSPLADNTPAAPTNVCLDALVAFDWRIAIGDDALTQEELASLAAAKTPLVRIRGLWAEIQPSELQQAVEFLRKNRPGRMTVFEALRQLYSSDEEETGIPLAGLRANGWITQLLDSSDSAQQLQSLSQPEGFHGTLRPYQLRGISWLRFLARLGLGCCLADEMGLGKTIQLIGLFLVEREDGAKPGPTLLIVPTSLVGNWQRELERFSPSLRSMIHHGLGRLAGQVFIDEASRHDVVISTYALVYRDYEYLAAVNWHRIALDEAQNIKNPATKQTAAISSLRALHRLGMTGTPVENRLAELWSIMNFLNPGHLGSATEFRRRFAVPIERFHDDDRAQRLRGLIRPFVLRRRKTDPTVLADLPEKMEMKVYCNLTKEQAALYEAIVGGMLGEIDRSVGIQRRGLILAALTKLKQVCNHPAHFLADHSALPNRSGKCSRLTEMLEELLASDDNALIFTQFRVMGDLLKNLIERTFDRNVLFLHGGTPRTQRDDMVQKFQQADGDSRIFILSLRAGGFGLNLTAANHVFHFDRWWNPAVEDQATDRVHRVGQVKQVQVHKFVCIGTLEERVDAMLEQKRTLAQNILGSGEDWLTQLSTDQLRELFQLSKEAVGDE